MINKKSFILIACMLSLALAMTVYASKNIKTNLNDERPQYKRHIAGHHRSLDDEYTQLRYVKTTDYGVTWSGVLQAGDISALDEVTGALADFSATATASRMTSTGMPSEGASS